MPKRRCISAEMCIYLSFLIVNDNHNSLCFCRSKQKSMSDFASPIEELMQCVRDNMSSLREPTAYDKVYKDECIFSFDTFSSPSFFLCFSFLHSFFFTVLDLILMVVSS